MTDPAPTASAISDEQINALPVWSNFVGLWPETRVEIARAVLALQPAMSGAVPDGHPFFDLLKSNQRLRKKYFGLLADEEKQALESMFYALLVAPAAPIEAAQPASSSARADPMGSEAFKRYLKECDDGAISPDAAGAFHWAWMNRLSSALAVGAVAWVSPEQFHAHPDGGDDGSGRYLPVRKSMVGKFTMPLFDTPSTGQDAAQAVAWPAEMPLRIQVSYSPGDWDTFIYGVTGHLSMDILTNIEASIRGEDPEALFKHGPGDYLLSGSYFQGQYGPEGQCEWAPCWELDIEGFRPPPIDASLAAQGDGGTTA